MPPSTNAARRTRLRCAAGAIAAAGLLALPATAGADAFGQLGTFGSIGTSDGQFTFPQFLTVDPTDSHVIVGDAQPSQYPDPPQSEVFRLVPFTSTGTPLPATAAESAAAGGDLCTRAADGGTFIFAQTLGGAALDATGGRHVLYMTRADNTNAFADCVQRLDLSTGSYAVWRTFPRGVNKITNPGAIATVQAPGGVQDANGVALAGNVYVAGQGPTTQGGQLENLVQRFDAGGSPIGSPVGGTGTTAGKINLDPGSESLTGIAADPSDGSLWVLDRLPDPTPNDTPEDDGLGRLQHFSATGQVIAADEIDASLAHPWEPDNGLLTLGQDGSLYVADTTTSTVYRYSPKGTYLSSFGTLGVGSCQFGAIQSLAAAADGSVYVLDSTTGTRRVVRLGAGGSGCGLSSGDQAPTVSFGASAVQPTTPIKNKPVTVTATGSDSDATGIASYEWDVDGNTANGFERQTGTTNAVTFTPTSVGDRAIRVKVTDTAGLFTVRTLRVTVRSLAPTAAFTVSPDAPQVGQSVSFDASGSSDADGSVASYLWDFAGDGSFQAAPARTTYAFVAPGTYTVRLKVVDDSGDASAIVRRDVTVAAPPAPAGGGDGGGSGAAGGAAGPVGPSGSSGRPQDTTPPKLAVRGGTLGVVKRGVRLQVGCPSGETSCTGSAVLSARKGKKTIRLGTARFEISGGKTSSVTIRLGAAAAKLLRRGRLAATATVKALDAAGNSATTVVRVTLSTRKR